MPIKHKDKYSAGFKFGQYEIISPDSYVTQDKKYHYGYKVRCTVCGYQTFRHECDIEKNIKCRECMRSGYYSLYRPGDVVNGLKILEIQPQMTKKHSTIRGYLCSCVVDGYTSVHLESNLIKGKGCPVCAGIVVLRGVNDIATKAQWMLNLLNDPNDGYQYSIGSKTKIRFKCPECGTVTEPRHIHTVYKAGTIQCRRCGDGFSTPEKTMYTLLESKELDFQTQVRFDWSDNRIYDFYIQSLNMIIETHGSQHYTDRRSSSWDSLDYIKWNDDYKREIALMNGIESYVEVNCNYTSPLDILNSCVSSLGKYISVDNLDKNELLARALKSKCITVGQMWNDGIRDVATLANTANINSHTARKYLKLLSEIEYLNTPYPIKKKAKHN